MKCKRYNAECERGCTTVCACENSYCPSNGTEGCGFTEGHCDNCLHQNTWPDGGPYKRKDCEILLRTLFYYPFQKEYPSEWIYKDGKPTCTKFQKWDWGNDGDPDDPNNPLAPPPPPDPNQLNLFPLYPAETDFNQNSHELRKETATVQERSQ